VRVAFTRNEEARGASVRTESHLCCQRAASRSRRRVAGTVPQVSQPVPNAALKRYNMHCMPCTGHFYCVDGTIGGVRACPPNRPYVLSGASSAQEQCLCDSGYAFTRDMQFEVRSDRLSQYRLAPTTVPKLGRLDAMLLNASDEAELDSSCSQCAANRICTPLYTSKQHVIQCPRNTMLSTLYSAVGEDNANYYTVKQACVCVPGYYASEISTEVRQYLSLSLQLVFIGISPFILINELNTETGLCLFVGGGALKGPFTHRPSGPLLGGGTP